MLDVFRRHLETSGFIPDGARVLVGYSGGADSTCLLHLLKRAEVDIVAGHLNHGQRPEADREQKLCEAFCQEMDIPFATGRADVPGMAADLKIGLEEAGRNARYAFFRQAAFRLSCRLVATAHTRSDQVETILLNLARGSGLSGLSGIPARRENIVRPLLPFSRSETRAYCEQHGLWFHDDPANEDLSFSRARVRHRILPELRAINPASDESIVRLGLLAAEEDGFLNGMAAAALEQAEISLNGDLAFLTRDCELVLDRNRISTLPRVLFKRAMRLATEALGSPLDFDQTEAFADGVVNREKGSVTAEGGEVVAEWSSGVIAVRQLKPVTPFRHRLTVPGETQSEEFGWTFTAFQGSPSGRPPSRQGLDTEMDRRGVKGDLYFRTAKEGDRIQPLGFDGHRKISDLLSEAGLTQAARARLPIVCDMVGPIWVPNVCLDERVKPKSDTDSAIILRFGAESAS